MKKGDKTSVSSNDDESVIVSNVVTQPEATPHVMSSNVSTTIVDELEVTLLEPATTNGLIIEMQNLLSVPCYECVNQKTMKNNELIGTIHDQLFSNSARIGVAEQLIRGKGHFAHPYDKVPIETHSLNNNNDKNYLHHLHL